MLPQYYSDLHIGLYINLITSQLNNPYIVYLVPIYAYNDKLFNKYINFVCT